MAIMLDGQEWVRMALASFATGIATHLALYRHGEWDLKSSQLILVYTTIYCTGIAFVTRGSDDLSLSSIAQSTKLVSGLALLHLAGVFLSILTYRLFFHRLKSISGPLGGRLSNFSIIFRSSSSWQLYNSVAKLHKQYGDFVRVGPRSVSVIHPEFVKLVHGPQTVTSKGVFYNFNNPRTTMHSTRDKKEHAIRRKVWDKSFSTKALKDYEPRASKYMNKLMEKIRESEGKPLDIHKWMGFYTFDLMGDLSFATHFNNMENGKLHPYAATVHAPPLVVALIYYTPWILPIMKMIPFVSASMHEFQAYSSSLVDKRAAMKPDVPDVFSALLEAYESNPNKSPALKHGLDGDADTIVIAGSDTSAIALTMVVFFLAQHPEQVAKLRNEYESQKVDPSSADHMQFSKLKHLDAVINETLRLWPPVPSGVQRVTPKEGLTIGDVFIPGDVNIQFPIFAANRDERYFHRAGEFIPERWTDQPELIIDSCVFVPFMTGPYACVGKQLALLELRQVTSNIIDMFDVKFAPGQTAESFYSKMQEGFVLIPSSLDLVFTPRK